MNDPAAIQKNIDARKKAEEAIEELELFIDSSISEERFWELIAEDAAAKAGRVLLVDGPGMKAMTYEQAIAFEKEIVPDNFKQHRGRRVRDVPHQYWLKITETVFNRKLARYLASTRFQELQG